MKISRNANTDWSTINLEIVFINYIYLANEYIVNHRQLHFAKVLAETQSFVQTASICHSTQPTVSNAIARLESELGSKLFDRTTRMVEVTAFGAYLLPWIEATLNSRQELQSAAKSYHNPELSILRIGLSPLVDTGYLNQQLAPFRKANPATELFFKECFMDDLPARLQRQQLDIALVPRCSVEAYDNKLEAYVEPLVFIPQVVHQNSVQPETISLSEVATHPIILTGGQCGLNTTIKALFHDQGMQLNSYRGQAMSYRIIEEWSELGIGAGLLPQRKVSANMAKIIPVTSDDGDVVEIQYFWVWKNVENNASCLYDFINFLH